MHSDCKDMNATRGNEDTIAKKDTRASQLPTSTSNRSKCGFWDKAVGKQHCSLQNGVPPNALRFSCRRGARKTVKMPTILRAEGGQLQAPVGRRAVSGFIAGY